jgi:hypothetical protein
LICAVGILVTLVAFGAVAADGFPDSDRADEIVDSSYPIAAIDALNRPGVRLFTQDSWAGFAIDRAWPNLRVYYDTRVDLYGRERAIRYARTIAAFPGWDRELDSTCTTAVLVRHRQPLARVLELSPSWRIERQDSVSITFTRRQPAPGCPPLPIR